ncbi:MAG: hypothetical protein ACOC9Z_06350 [Chloroflexota bacterium]
MGHDALSPLRTRVRLAAMAGHMTRDPVAARRAALADVLADGRPHTREQIWTAVQNQIGEGCWGKRPEETLWRDLRTLREGGLRIAYSRRSGIEGYYLQDPIIERPQKQRRQAPDWQHTEFISQMTVPEKNRQAFAAAEFALQQKRLILAQEHPDWTSEQIDKEARRQVYGGHEVP